MALSITTNYAGPQAGGWLAEALASAKFGSGEHFTMHKTLGGKLNLSTVSMSGLLKPYTCDFVSGGTVNVADRILDPKRFSLQFEECYDVFNTMWTDLEYGAGVNQTELPKTFGDLIIGEMLKHVAKDFDRLVLTSDVALSSVYGEFNGLFTMAALDADTIKVTGTPLTKENIIAEMEKVYFAIPEAVIEKDDVKWLMNSGDIRKYKAALAAAGNGIIAPNTNVDASIFYDGTLELVPSSDVPAGKMMVISKSNVHVGTNYTDVDNQINLIDKRTTTNENKFSLRMDFVLDVNYGFSQEVVIYG